MSHRHSHRCFGGPPADPTATGRFFHNLGRGFGVVGRCVAFMIAAVAGCALLSGALEGLAVEPHVAGLAAVLALIGMLWGARMFSS